MPRHEVDLPRLAVYRTWGNTQEVGWVRHALDKFEVPLRPDLQRAGQARANLRDAYDVIVIPNQGRSGKGLVFDSRAEAQAAGLHKERSVQDPRDVRRIGRHHGRDGPAGRRRIPEIRRSRRTAGHARSGELLPAGVRIDAHDRSRRPSPQFYAPGPIVEAEILQPSHPIFYGYAQKTIPVRYANGPLLTVPERDREQQVLMRFPGADKSVLSGLMRGVAETRNRPAIVDVPTGKGRVMLFATNPCYRWQNHGEFTMLFNAMLHYNDIKTIEKKPAQTAEVK